MKDSSRLCRGLLFWPVFVTCAVGLGSFSMLLNGQQRSDLSRPAQAAVGFDGLIQYLRESSRDPESDAVLVKLIERFGLAFRPTPDQLTRLRNAANSSTLAIAIEGARLPPPPPALLDAAVSISCAPIDCELSINGSSAGRTQGGTHPWITLRPGPVTIAASDPNYESAQSRHDLVLAPGELQSIAFKFVPSRRYLTDAGRSLLQGMVDALGKASDAHSAAVVASGTLYLRDANGRTVLWSLRALIRGSELVRLDLSRLNELYTFPWTATRAKKRPPKYPPALEAVAARLGSAVLSRQILLLTAPGTSAEASNPPQPVLRVKGADSSYLVTLDSLFRPLRIENENAPSTDSPTYMYSEYSQLDGELWPGIIQVITSSPGLTFEVRFSGFQHADEPPARGPEVLH